MNTQEAVQLVLDREGISKYRLAKTLGVVSSTSVNQWLRGTHMSTLVATQFEELYKIKIEDAYDPLSAPN
tara:strand:- start:2665 stop:2874 length:210 start_codon:yes stop_codon:yes gene_type:complete